MHSRRNILNAIDDLILAEDGTRFQRLVTRLLRQLSPWLISHAVHKDRGADATIMTPIGTAYVCASITATLQKIRGDVHKLRSRAKTEAVVFCTPVGVSNEKSDRWKSAINEETGVRLIILERAWLVDQCLQPENDFIVTEELRPEAGPLTGSRQLAFGPLLALTPDTTPIFQARTAVNNEYAFAAWFNTPLGETPEGVYLATMQHDEVHTLRLGTGADCSCIAIKDQVFTSWVFRPSSGERWNINVSTVSAYKQEPRTTGICNISELNTAPELLLYRGEPIVAALSGGLVSEKASLHFYDLTGREITRVDVHADRESRMRVASDGARIFATVLCQMELCLYRFDGTKWTTLCKLPGGDTPIGLKVWRFDMVFGAGQLFIAYETAGDFNLSLAALDGRSGVADEVHLLAMLGKFPSLATNGESVVICWSGTPALPAGFQRRSHAAELISQALWMEAEEKVIQQTHQILEAQGTRDGCLPAPDPWAQLWCATLDARGRCDRSYGPLGHGRRSNWHTDIACNGSDGVMAVLSGGDEDSTCLLARRFSIS